mgnify:CR=1 FL=1
MKEPLVLLTGSGGFVATALTSLLGESSGRVSPVSRDESDGWRLSIARAVEAVAPNTPIVLVHAAVPSKRHSKLV